MSNDLFDKKKVGESDKFNFYTTIFCNTSVKGYKILLTEDKENKSTEYLLFYKGQPVYANTSIEDIHFRITILEKIRNDKRNRSRK